MKTKNSTNPNFQNKLINLLFLFSLYQLILHIYFSITANDPRLLIPTAIAFLHDILLLFSITLLAQLITNLTPHALKKTAYAISAALLISAGLFLSLYPGILREYLAFPVNIFESDIGSAETLFVDYFGFKIFIPPFIAFILSISVIFFGKEIKHGKKFYFTGFSIILLILLFTLQKPSAQPLVYSIQKTMETALSGKERVVPSLGRHKYSATGNKLQPLSYPNQKISNYKHILLIVLEGETAETFEKDFLTIPNGFYEQNKNNAVYYNNYFSGNLDSYTSLITMLTAVQVPYRAYADESLYENVNNSPSINEDLHNRGFKNFFISCYEYQPFVPVRKFWDKIYERKDLPGIENWLTLGSSKMEMATEDKSAIPSIVENLKTSQNSFILHELVYGHSPEWRAKTGKTQDEYHNEYLLSLANNLKKENIYDSTLLIIVSDHGDRTKSAEMENYRIPLLLVGKNISTAVKSEFLTHLDLPQLIYHYLSNEKHPESRSSAFFVGSTEKWIYGKIQGNKEYLFIDDASGTVISQSGTPNASAINNEFREYLINFNYTFNR